MIGVNVLGTVGYMLALTTWVMLVAVIVALLMQRNIIVLPETIVDTPSQPSSSSVSGLTVGVTSVLAAIMVFVSLVVLIIFPYLVSKWSSRTLRRLLLLVKVLPTKRHMFLAKGIVTTVPLLGFLVIATVVQDVTMTFAIVYSATVTTSVVAIAFFFAQLLLARALHLADENIW